MIKCIAYSAILGMLIYLQGSVRAETVAFVKNGDPRGVTQVRAKWIQANETLTCGGMNNYLVAGKTLGDGDFRIRVRMSLLKPDSTAASLMIGANHFGFDGSGRKLFVEGDQFGKTQMLGDASEMIRPGKPFVAEVVRKGDSWTFLIDGKQVHQTNYRLDSIPAIAIRPWRAEVRVYDFSASGKLTPVKDAAVSRKQNRAPRLGPNARTVSRAKTLQPFEWRSKTWSKRSATNTSAVRNFCRG